MSEIDNNIPKEIVMALQILKNANFEAYLVGGCVRDLLRKEKPKDWDIATSATPENIQELFEHSFYENNYGTVGVVNDETEDKTLKIIEITPFRSEGAYKDGRRPSSVCFSTKIEDDLKRRDFTVNAIAYDIYKNKFIDPHKGQEDLKSKVLRAVGSVEDRFSEDYLRMLRAVRFAAQLGFSIEQATEKAVVLHAKKVQNVSRERIRDEFIKIVDSRHPVIGIKIAQKLGILSHIVPELELGIGIKQRGNHIYDVWEHNLMSLQHAADKNWSFLVKLSALLHDIAKPHTRKWSRSQNLWTFHGHDVVGERVSREILNRLLFPKETVINVSKLVRWHLFFSDPDKITLSAVRRLVKNVGKEHIWDLMKLRACDRIGTGLPKEAPYRLRKYESMIEEVLQDPISVSMLKIDGVKIMNVTQEKPGSRIGFILHALLEEVLENPKLNTDAFLVKRTIELSGLSDSDLKTLGERGAEKKETEQDLRVSEIRKRHWVK